MLECCFRVSYKKNVPGVGKYEMFMGGEEGKGRGERFSVPEKSALSTWMWRCEGRSGVMKERNVFMVSGIILSHQQYRVTQKTGRATRHNNGVFELRKEVI